MFGMYLFAANVLGAFENRWVRALCSINHSFVLDQKHFA